MRSVCVDLVSLVIVVSSVVGDAKANHPLRRHGCRRRRMGQRWVGSVGRAEEDDGPEGAAGYRGRRSVVIRPEGSSTRPPHDGEQTLAASGSPETAA